MQFDWDKGNVGHISAHGITPAEIEQVFKNGVFPVTEEIDDQSGELRETVIGETDAGRVLVVVWTERKRKVRTVTSFPANRKARRIYAVRRKGEKQ
jgi:hypothetical protein